MFFLTGTNMNKKTFDFTIIGGDMRQVCLAKLLALKGYCICHYGLCEPLKAPCIQPFDRAAAVLAYIQLNDFCTGNLSGILYFARNFD